MLTMGLTGLVTRMERGGTVFTLYVGNIGGRYLDVDMNM